MLESKLRRYTNGRAKPARTKSRRRTDTVWTEFLSAGANAIHQNDAHKYFLATVPFCGHQYKNVADGAKTLISKTVFSCVITEYLSICETVPGAMLNPSHLKMGTNLFFINARKNK